VRLPSASLPFPTCEIPLLGDGSSSHPKVRMNGGTGRLLCGSDLIAWYRHVSTDKVFPTRRLLPLGSRWNIMAAENIAHRLIREPDTQVGHGAHDPVIAPPGIFLRHPQHQPLGFLVNSGTTPRIGETSIRRTCWR
jgi:hypothetical protein